MSFLLSSVRLLAYYKANIETNLGGQINKTDF